MPPALERLLGNSNDLLDLLLAPHLRDLADDLVVRGVRNLERLARSGLNPFIVDKRLALQERRVLEVQLGSLSGHAAGDYGLGGGSVSQSCQDGCHER